MQCPIDQSELVMTERQGVEIDYCPKCRGVWLDRGELDKIIERSASFESSAAQGDRGDRLEGFDSPEVGGLSGRVRTFDSRDVYTDDDDRRGSHDRYDDDDRRYGSRKRKKRGSFLEDLFDFD